MYRSSPTGSGNAEMRSGELSAALPVSGNDLDQPADRHTNIKLHLTGLDGISTRPVSVRYAS